MSLKTPTHTGQANPNPNIKAQANTLSAKSLSPFKPKGTVKQSQTKSALQTQTVGLSEAKQTQTEEPQPLSPSREQTLSPSRRQFIEQYGAYALVTPVALYAMMSPNRAMAQAGSVGVVVRPTVLNNKDRIENFDITTITDGIIDSDGDLELLQGEKYIAPDGVTYTCVTDSCYISPTPEEGGGGKAYYGSQFDITYPDNIGSSDQAVDDIVDDIVADTADDPVVDDRPRVLNDQDRIENYDVTTKTDGEVTLDGDLLLDQGDKYTAPDGVVYTCSSDDCIITPTEGGGAKANHDSTFDITYPVADDADDAVVADDTADDVADTTDDDAADDADDTVADTADDVADTADDVADTTDDDAADDADDAVVADDTADDAVADTADDVVDTADDVADTADDDAADDPVVVDRRPRTLLNRGILPEFDITKRGHGTLDGSDLKLLRGEYYTTPDGVRYTCTTGACFITPLSGGRGQATYSSTYSISYSDDAARVAAAAAADAAADAAAVDAVDDVVDDAVAGPVVVVRITDGYVVPNFDISRRTDGFVDQGELTIYRDEKYIGVDGKHYTCDAGACFIDPDGYVTDF